MDGDIPNLFRIIDANLNRLKEGLRVIEDINRYLENNYEICKELKTLRHLCKIDKYENILKNRDSNKDIFKKVDKLETQRIDIKDILIANFKRSQESSRVLEEIYKLIDIKYTKTFKEIRFKLYYLEKCNISNCFNLN